MESFVSAIVLAAGGSSRMGSLKQLMKVGERTLLEITLGAVKESAAGETVLVLGHQADTILKSLRMDETTKLVVNEAYRNGMSTSIQAGLRAVSSDARAALIVLADQPFIKSAVIDQLISEYQKSGASIILPVYKGFRGNPVLIDRSLFNEMMEISGDIGCRSLFGLHSDKIRKLPVEDIGVLIDIDTAEDLAKAQSIQDHPAQEVWSSLQLEDRSMEQMAHLLIVGQDEIAQSLIKLGRLLKFRVAVVDPLITKEDAPDADQILNDLDLTKANVTTSTYIVVASRGRFDEEALEQALSTPAPYIALVGSKKRGAEVIQRLRSVAVSEDSLKRVRFPAGLEIHASTPEEIALSIMAEVVSIQRSMPVNPGS